MCSLIKQKHTPKKGITEFMPARDVHILVKIGKLVFGTNLVLEVVEIS